MGDGSIDEMIRRRFESAWQLETEPRIEDFVPTAASGSALLSTLEELVHIDLEFRWNKWQQESNRTSAAKQPNAIEQYLARFPSLNQPDIMRRLIETELVARRKCGDFIAADEYPRRFPEVNLESRDLCLPLPATVSHWPQNETIGPVPDATCDLRNVLELPEKIGRYKVQRLLGRGGFAVVYLAQDSQLERQVALKVPRLDRFQNDEELDRCVLEARNAAQLNHPGIVQIYDVQRTPNEVYIVQQYIPGQDLAACIESEQLSPRQVVELTIALTEAVGFAHRQGFVHRDLKPANVLLDERGVPHLADFGLAIHESVQSQHAGELAGTYPYMSPEQVRGESHRLDGRSDIWSLGVIFYELLTRQRPFMGENVDNLLQAIKQCDPLPPGQLNPVVPPELERICSTCLAKRAADRYQTAAELIDELQHWLRASPRTDASGTSQPLRIVPKGLRSYDAGDADFFLELLPGPHDREGLPKSVRFWKNQIEQPDGERTFAVGLMYGPSGCGKSSLVKAGLIPRLSKDVVTVYVEATAADTEVRVIKGLCKRCPELSGNAKLTELITNLRKAGGSRGRKVVLVIDQFEQWLHAHDSLSDNQLVPALRQCHGSSVQCLILVRDDFYAAVNRFFQQLETPLVEGHNSALLDLFDADHARKVLVDLGQAYGKLPPTMLDLQEQQRFIERAISDLSRNGKVVCVRLAVFAEMMKSRPWTEASLREVGGTEGVGVTFLEETFNANTAPPSHRIHQKAVRAVLKALLPEQGSKIKGQMQAYDQLLAAAGYQERRQDFEVLLGILDGGARLITPTEKDQTSESGEAAAGGGGIFYQLTHDYLVPSLRDWLTLKQKETRQGRAELRLSELAALWFAKPENRHLPSLWEYSCIRAMTDKRKWTNSQQGLMRRAGRIHLMRIAALLCVLLLLGWASYEINGRFQARSLVESLFSAKEDAVLSIVGKLQPYHRWASPLLVQQLAPRHKDVVDERHELHARIALLPSDATHADSIRKALLNPQTPYSYVGMLRDVLSPPGKYPVDNKLVTGFHKDFRDKGLSEDQRFRAGMVLATYSPTSPGVSSKQWTNEDLSFLAQQLIAANPEVQPILRECLRPIGESLLDSLELLFINTKLSETQQLGAANALADFASQDAARLSRMLSKATPTQFEILYERLRILGDEAGKDTLRELALQETNNELLPDQRIAQGKERAGAAFALLRKGSPPECISALRVRDDPESLTQFVHRCRSYGVEPSALLKCLGEADLRRQSTTGRQREVEDRALCGLLLSLGEFSLEELPIDQHQPLIDRLADWYANDPSSAIHSVTGWLMRHWGQNELTRIVDHTPVPYSLDRQWFTLKIHAQDDGFLGLGINPRKRTSYMTFVVIPAGEYETGPLTEKPEAETLRSVRIDYPLAVLDREVTWEEFDMYDSQWANALFQAIKKEKSIAPRPSESLTLVDWYDAVKFCRWLTKQTGLNEEQQAYANPESLDEEMYPADPNPAARGAPLDWPLLGMDRAGFRLPTETEWEIACRGGARAAWSFGEDVSLSGYYAWYSENGGGQIREPRLKRPNLRGLFDMHGNVAEWCHNWNTDGAGLKISTLRVIRGGSSHYSAKGCQSSYRIRQVPTAREDGLGFRIVFVPTSPAKQQSVD